MHNKQTIKKHNTQEGYASLEFPYIHFPKRSLISFPPGVELLVFFASWLTVFRFAIRLQENGFW